MKPLSTIKNVYFLGIGGIGMSALAQYFVLNGKKVSGYDKTPGRMTEKLQTLNISVIFEDTINKIPSAFRQKEDTLVVYTPAVPKDLKIHQYFIEQDYCIKKRAEILGTISSRVPTLAIAGTHGKTTTSTILAHLLKQSGYNITAFLGGVSENYQTNFIGDGNEVCVVEADEYDRSFLQLTPHMAAITAMDADHLDIYGNEAELITSFHQFAEKLPNTDHLFYKKGLALKGHSVGVDMEAEYCVQDISIEHGTYNFTFKTPETSLYNLQFSIPGRHNLLNAGIALAMALKYGAEEEALVSALKSFKGVERRFTYHIKRDNFVLIEDYAHHPEELKAAHQAAREMFPNQKITAIFQPHLYTRTRDFADEFAVSLSLFDEVFLLPIYPAREKAIPGIDSQFLLDKITLEEKHLISKSALKDIVKPGKRTVIMMLGAGDIGREVKPLKEALLHEA